MAKAKAPRWLTEAFADGVDEYEADAVYDKPAYRGAFAWCWLAQFDPRRRPCEGPLERFHFINRQRVEAVVDGNLPDRWELLEQLEAQMGEPDFWYGNYAATIAKAHGELVGSSLLRPLADLVLIAAWDARNGGWGCEGHHRRLDGHLTPGLLVPITALPDRAIECSNDYGTEQALADRFPAP